MDTRIQDYSILDTTTGCLNWQRSVDGRGYPQMWWNGKLRRAHRVAWMQANGMIDSSVVVMHKCDNPKCVNVDHLMIGTQQDNMDDMMKKDRHFAYRGAKKWSAKLTEKDVLAIRASSKRECDLAREYNVAACTINQILHRKKWIHI